MGQTLPNMGAKLSNTVEPTIVYKYVVVVITLCINKLCDKVIFFTKNLSKQGLLSGNLVPRSRGWAKPKARSGQIRFVPRDCLSGMWQASQ